MDQEEIAQKLNALYPVIELDENEYDPTQTYKRMVYLYRDDRHVETIYGPKIDYLVRKRYLYVWHIDSVPELIYKTDPRKLIVENTGEIDLSRFPNLERIVIREMDPNILKLDGERTKIKSVALSRVDNTFPNWLYQCPNLERLWIYNSKVSQLPKWLAELPIKELVLKSLPMNDLPDWLPYLPLKKLEIEGLPLGRIPEVYRNWNYPAIRLPNCAIYRIPEWVEEMDWLRSLKLSHNSIKEVPRFLFEKLKLKGLNLSHNQIRELPEGVWADQDFSLLDLSHNQIQKLPDDFGEMKVKKLKLNHNPIEELPNLKHYQRDILELWGTNLIYPMFWKQDHTWLKNMAKIVVPDWWDKEMIYAARRLIGFPKYPIYTYTEYIEQSRLRHG
ncbi:MAG: leucine-rich repeat domain-containing protein [Methanobacteriota archaeon]|nr:MAG: leucine-rich repeat domain-containing protein [Euryarchaeota archaeon]